MIIYLAIVGAATCCSGSTIATNASGCATMRCRWRRDRAQLPVFASYDNRARGVRCLVAGVAVGRTARRRADVRPGAALARRLEAATGAALVAGIVVAAFHAFMLPHCLQRPEGVSPEEERLWLSNVKEARPSTARLAHGLADRRAAGDRPHRLGGARLARGGATRSAPAIWAPPCRAFAATLLLLWQTRTGPAAQMLAVVGAAALGWFLVPLVLDTRAPASGSWARSSLVVIGAGAAVPFVSTSFPRQADTAERRSARPTGCADRCGACIRSRSSRRAWFSASSIWAAADHA